MVVAGSQRQAGKDEAGRPAFGAFAECVGVARGDVGVGVAKQQFGFGRLEVQRVGTDLDELGTHPKPREPDRWIEAGHQHQHECGRRQFDEGFDGVVDRWIRDHVIVVDDEGGWGRARERVHEPSQQGPGIGGSGHEGGSDRFGDVWHEARKRNDQVAPEAGRVPVGGIGLKPGTVVSCRLPTSDQR